MRDVDARHTLITGPRSYNNAHFLGALRLPDSEDNLILTIHHYWPITFTMQGKRWLGQQRSATPTPGWEPPGKQQASSGQSSRLASRRPPPTPTPSGGQSSSASSAPPTTPTCPPASAGRASTANSPNGTASPGATGPTGPASRSTTAIRAAGTRTSSTRSSRNRQILWIEGPGMITRRPRRSPRLPPLLVAQPACRWDGLLSKCLVQASSARDAQSGSPVISRSTSRPTWSLAHTPSTGRSSTSLASTPSARAFR